MTCPSASTTVSPRTASRIVPYRTAVVPEARVAAMPPIVLSAPGSTVNIVPVSRNALFNCNLVTPASTVASMSSTLMRRMRRISRKSIVMPP